jgi:phosphoserine phosphatase RsbU/P
LGEKYATVVIARISRNGELEYVNCGHVPPLLVSDHQVTRPQLGNLPVGLLPDATYEAGKVQLKAGDRFIIVTDGVTEAENARGDFYDNERLEAVAGKSSGFEEIFTSVTHFCGGTPLNDDCTVVELVYTGETVPIFLRSRFCPPGSLSVFIPWTNREGMRLSLGKRTPLPSSPMRDHKA